MNHTPAIPAPFRREGVSRRLAPFVLAGSLGLVVLLDGGLSSLGPIHTEVFAVAMVLTALIAVGKFKSLPFWTDAATLIACVVAGAWPVRIISFSHMLPNFVCGAAFTAALAFGLFGPWERLPRWTQAVPWLLASLGLFTMHLFTHASGAVIFPLSALIVLWFALHQSRGELAVGVVVSVLTFLTPPLMGGADMTTGLLHVVTVVVFGFSVQYVVRRQREQSADIEAAEQLLREIGSGDPDGARSTICAGAVRLCAAACAIIYEVDAEGMLVPTASSLEPAPDVKLSLDGHAFRMDGTPLGTATRRYSVVDALVTSRPVLHSELLGMPDGITRMVSPPGRIANLAYPILRNGAPIGVISVAWTRKVERIDERIAATLDVLAAGAAAAFDQADSQVAIREGQRRFAALFNDPQLAIALTDQNAEVIQANEAFSSMFGIEANSTAGSLLAAAHPEHVAEAEADLERLRSGALAQSKVERRFRRSDGAEFWADVTTTAVPDANGVPAYWQNVLVDTTSRKHAEELQRLRLAVIQSATEATTEPELVSRVVATLGSAPVWDETEIWLTQPESGALVLANSWCKDGGRPVRKHRNGAARLSDGTLARTAASQGDVAMRTLGARHGRFATSRPAGGLEVAVPASTDLDVVGVLVLRSATLRDLDDDIRATLVDLAARFGELLARRRAEYASRAATARLQELSTMDPLTGLQNRRAFDERLNDTHPGRYAVLAIDLDNLKDINDAHGHEAGDHALRAAASVLSSAVRGQDLLARVGGDEFGVLLEGAGIDEAVAVAERMRLSARAVSLPSGLLAMSVGCAAAGPDDAPRALWSAADAALYEAKRGGKDRIACASDTTMRTTRHGADKVVMDLIANRSVVSVYQPIVDLSTRAVVGYEALARPRGAAPDTSVEAIFAAAHRLGVDRDLDWLCRRAAVKCAP